MSPRIRTTLACVGIALTALGSICMTLSATGCSGPFPSGRAKVDACLGSACPPEAPPAPASSR